jgi:hypothetical protein
MLNFYEKINTSQRTMLIIIKIFSKFLFVQSQSFDKGMYVILNIELIIICYKIMNYAFYTLKNIIILNRC